MAANLLENLVAWITPDEIAKGRVQFGGPVRLLTIKEKGVLYNAARVLEYPFDADVADEPIVVATPVGSTPHAAD